MGMLSKANRKKNRKLEVQIDEGILAALKEISDIRGIEVERIINIQLYSYISTFERSKIYGLWEEMPFGKYRGIVIEEVIRTDPRYLNWLLSESDIFRLSDPAQKLLEAIFNA